MVIENQQGARGTLQPKPQAVPPPWQSSGQLPCTCWRTEISVSPFSVKNGNILLQVTQGVVMEAEHWLWVPEFSLDAWDQAQFGSCCSHPLLVPTSLQCWAAPPQKGILQHFPWILIQSHAVTLPLPAPSFLCSFTQPVANFSFVWTQNLQAKLSKQSAASWCWAG